MADWNLPTITTAYADVLTYLGNKDFDAASLFLNEPSNHINGFIKLVRSPVKFQERSAGAWVDRVLDVTGGGTGAATAAGARTALGIGTMGVQDSSAVTISGGTIAGSGSGITNLSASALASGTVPDARFPATLPALNGSALTALNASALGSGTVPDARFPATLPALSGVNLTALNGANIASGQIPVARMGTGTPSASTVLLGDGTWGVFGMVKSVQVVDIDTTYDSNTAGSSTAALGTVLTTLADAAIVGVTVNLSDPSVNSVKFKITSTSQLTYSWLDTDGGTVTLKASVYIVEYKNVG